MSAQDHGIRLSHNLGNNAPEVLPQYPEVEQHLQFISSTSSTTHKLHWDTHGPKLGLSHVVPPFAGPHVPSVVTPVETPLHAPDTQFPALQ